MSLRVLEYSLAFANSYASITSNEVVTEIQNIAILYLRINSKTPDLYKLTLKVPNGKSVSWEVPVIKAPNYSKEELFAKKLYFLLPFYFFVFENRFEIMERTREWKPFLDELENILQQIEELESNGALTSVEKFSLFDNSRDVLNALLAKYPDLREEVSAIMATKDYRTESQKFYDEVLEEGISKGQAEERLASIRNVMSSFGVSVQKAMESLKIPKDEWDKYASQLR